MLKACSRCGKIHDTSYHCQKQKYITTDESRLRNRYSWRQKREEVKEKANYLCEVCKREGILTYTGLEVHHITKLKDNEYGLLENDNLICLCKLHHMMAENGGLSQDYLRQIAKERERD